MLRCDIRSLQDISYQNSVWIMIKIVSSYPSRGLNLSCSTKQALPRPSPILLGTLWFHDRSLRHFQIWIWGANVYLSTKQKLWALITRACWERAHHRIQFGDWLQMFKRAVDRSPQISTENFQKFCFRFSFGMRCNPRAARRTTRERPAAYVNRSFFCFCLAFLTDFGV